MDDQMQMPTPQQHYDSAPPQQPYIGAKKKGLSSGVKFVLFIVVLVLCSGGVYYWQHKKVNNLNTQLSSSKSQISGLNGKVSSLQATAKKDQSALTSANPYAGWKTYTLTKEKLSFKYPSNWTLTDKSNTGNDFESLTIPTSSNFNMTIGAGTAVSNANLPSGNKVVEADKVKFAGQAAFMDVDQGTASNPNDYIYDVRLSSSNSSPTLFKAKNIANTTVFVQVYYEGPKETSFDNITLSQLEADTNYKDALLVVDSMSY